MKRYNVAVAGAMGAVGQEMLKVLAQRNFPVDRITALGTGDSIGVKIPFGDGEVTVTERRKEAFEGVDIALFALSDTESRALAPEAVKAGCVVIDNSCAFRMDEDIPLVIPECNPEAIYKHKGIIASPNCTTSIALMAVYKLHKYANIIRMTASTYQAVSGAGSRGITELTEQTPAVLNGGEAKPDAFAHQIAFNLIPHIDRFEENGYTREEMKMLRESRKILGAPELRVSCTCVRVPVYRSHSESITIETERELTPKKARELLRDTPGVKLFDDPVSNTYPMPVLTSGGDDVWVGRIRKDISAQNSLSLWCVGDQLRKGAALNTVQIAEKLIEMGLM